MATHKQAGQGRGSNLSHADKVKGGKNSHKSTKSSSTSSSTKKEGKNT